MSVVSTDWRDAASYAWLTAGDRRCFAWEWLRRTPSYVAAWEAGARADTFGLLSLVDPTLDARQARPLWTASFDPGVLVAEPVAADSAACIELTPLLPNSTIVFGALMSHILISDGLRSIRIDLRGDRSIEEVTSLHWRISAGPGIEQRIAALAQITGLLRMRSFARSLHPPERRAARWILMLRAYDAATGGATLREIVPIFFGVDTADARWRSRSTPWRLRAQRLRSGARRCIVAGSRGWLAMGVDADEPQG